MRALAIFMLVVSAAGQSPALPRFEVASIKPAGDFGPGFGGTGFSRISPGGRLTIEMSPVAVLISSAYGLRNYQILGGPDWINTARFNIEAKAEENTSPDEMNLMMRFLLEDRFKLKLHRETRELPIYQLVVGKRGPKIKLSDAQNPPRGASLAPEAGRLAPGLVRRGRGEIEGRAIPLDGIAGLLTQQMDRPVINKTELMGLYDILLRWTPDAGTVVSNNVAPSPNSVDGPSIFTALEEQLGLKLEAVRGSVDVVVIDSVERPTEN
jgi:uncharacterized protein (TIGR03435 family)